MNMTISKKDIPLLLGVLGLVIAVLVYYFVYMPYQDKISDLTDANSAIQQQINDLADKTAQKSYYESETQRMNNEVNKIYAMFPPEREAEDAVMECLTLEQLAPMEATSINFEPAVAVYTLGGGTADAAEADTAAADNTTDTGDTTVEEDVAAAQNGETTTYSEGTVPAITFSTGVLPAGYQGDYGPVTLNNNSVTYVLVTSYDGVKRIFDYITSNTDKESIKSISMAMDAETGLLTCNIVMNEYSLTGTGKVYTYPELPAVQIGTDNLFGTVSLTGGSTLQSASEGNDTESVDVTDTTDTGKTDTGKTDTGTKESTKKGTD